MSVKMCNIDYTIAELPINEFMALDPWYWDKSADCYYLYEYDISMEAQGHRDIPKKGEIYWYDFDISTHTVRPGIIIEISHNNNIICPLGSIPHRSDWKDFPANIKVDEPLRGGEYLPNRSFAITNRFRYIKLKNLHNKIGDAKWMNYEEIRKSFIERNMVNNKLPKESIMTEGLIYPDDNIEDIISDL